jgi:hypothetical protein
MARREDSPVSVPALLAAAIGVPCAGDRPCFFCGAACDGGNPASDHVKDSFTGRQGVRAPGSDSVCSGCVLALREDAEVDQIDGARRRVVKGCMRAFSWVITADRALAASKAHLKQLREICLSPPAPPFALVLSDSGKTHQLYRGVVNRGGPVVSLTLEGERIDYRPADLADALALAGRVAAACGKPALDAPDAGRAIRLFARYPDSADGILIDWQSRAGSPTWRLATWLSPGMKECSHEFPAEPDDPGHRGDPPPARRAGRPAAEDARRVGRPRDPRRGQPTLFDLG